MTVPISTKAAASAAELLPRARKAWISPSLARLDGTDAENSATPVGPDGGFSSGS